MVALAFAVALSACNRSNPAYCDEDTPCENGASCDLTSHECSPRLDGGDGGDGGNGGGGCGSEGCPADTPICDEEDGQCRACASGSEECAGLDPEAPVCHEGACVECAEPSQCSSETPACEQNQCVACTEGEDGDAACAANDAENPYCLDGACVACQSDADCSGETPVCETDSGQCRACESGSECASGVCDVFTGACAEQADVLYVEGGDSGDGIGCGKFGEPCATISGDEGALAKVEGDNTYIFVRAHGAGDRYSETISINTGTVIIAGAGGDNGNGGPRLDHDDDAPILNVTDGASVRVEGVAFDVDSSNGENAIACQSSELSIERAAIERAERHAISANNCDVELSRSLIRDSSSEQVFVQGGSVAAITDSTIELGGALGIAVQGSELVLYRSRVERNAGGGVDAEDSDIDLENNVIAKNGDDLDNSEVGGVRVRGTGPNASEGRFAFNTVALNEAGAQSPAPGVDCDSAGDVLATSNIVYASPLEAGNTVSPGCSWTWRYSNVQGGVEGESNIDEDPEFVAPVEDDNYRITAGSPCVDAGEPGTGVEDDVTGQPRPEGEAPDCGAYEYR